jgi:hypothetical protein
MTASVAASTSELAAFSSAQELTAQELDQARLFLQQTQSYVVGATKGLSEEQWKFKPAPDRWSIAENLDHIITVQERVLGPILDQLANEPAPPSGVDCKQVDSVVLHQFSTRLSKFTAPEVIQPASQIIPAENLNRLNANYARLLACLESTPGLRQHAGESRPLKAVSNGAFEYMDGYQWILAVAAHTERHTKQMLEVMADPGYPV